MLQSMDTLVGLCKRRGFIFPGSEIYGGLGGTWDYGSVGALLKNNIKQAWLKRFVQGRGDVEFIDGTVLMARRTWQASGHEASFSDMLVECKYCHARYRADHMAEGAYKGQGKAKEANQCTECGKSTFTDPKQFNMMFATHVGPVQDEERKTYLRPETAQSMFTNFANVSESARRNPPFGIAQMGRCFRNEITTGNFIFRSREFEIAELEYFVRPGTDETYFEQWLKDWEAFFIEDLKINKDQIRHYEHPKESLAHYSKRTVDLEYKFPFGWGEIAGVANRTDYDLKRHTEFSKQELSVFEEATKTTYVPYVIEPTLGIDRAFVTCLINHYEEVQGGRTTTTESTKEAEVVLHLPPALAPYKVAVLPLSKKEPLTALAKEIVTTLRGHWVCAYDEVASIGRRYRRHDEIGTPYCVTVDFDSLDDKQVTVRDRDTMQQERIAIQELATYLKEKI